MVFRSTPQLGPGLEDVIAEGEVWFDVPGKMTLISPRLGNPEWGTDGKKYIMVQASADIAATAVTGTQVAITEPGFTAATDGAGGFYAPVDTAVPEGAFFWAREGTTV